MTPRPPLDEWLSLLEAIWPVSGMVWFDSVNGTAGTAYPIGTAEQPVNNVADALTIAVARKVNTFRIVDGVFTLAANIDGYNFIGSGWVDLDWIMTKNNVVLAGFTASNCVFEKINVEDYVTPGNVTNCTITRCGLVYVNNVTNCNIYDSYNLKVDTAAIGSEINGLDLCTITTSGSNNFVKNVSFLYMNAVISTRFEYCFINGADLRAGKYSNCVFMYQSDSVQCTLTGNINLALLDCSGKIVIAGATSISTALVSGVGLDLVILNSCTHGQIDIFGDVDVTNQANGTTVNDYSNATALAAAEKIAATTIDLNQAAATYDLFTGTTQAVILESLNIKMPNIVAGGALTSISIQTDDVTPGVIISAADGAVANLTAEADLGWTGTLYITVGTKIRLTIAGGAHGVAYVCNVTAKYRAVVAGGYLAK